METRKKPEDRHNVFSDEFPSLSYLIGLVGNDFDFNRKFLAILKSEFPLEMGTYLLHINMEEPRAAAEWVHKLKYRISALGMEKSFEFAEKHQEQLCLGNTSFDFEFKLVLKKIDIYLQGVEPY